METSMICALPDDLLLQILVQVPTKDAIATSVLSQRWRYVWTMLPSLQFIDEGISESFGCFIDKSLQLHKAPKLHKFIVELGPHYPVDVDVGEWVENAVNSGVEDLDFKLLWSAEPTRFPKSLYICDTLVRLTLSNKILVDVSSSAHLPSLEYLMLDYVVYKDQDSLDMLLSSSHVLKCLRVNRQDSDNLKNFTVKVSSLERLQYKSTWPEDEVEDGEEEEEDEVEDDDLIESLVIDCPALRNLDIWNIREDNCSIENIHYLELAYLGFTPDVKFLRCLSSVKYLMLYLSEPLDESWYALKFPQLINFYFSPTLFVVDWLEPLIFFLQNSPKLEVLVIHNGCEGPSSSWNQPSTIPECLLTHLEDFYWGKYEGKEVEKQLLTYILANSKCLKTVKIFFIATHNHEETQKEIESMPRISTSSRLLFSVDEKEV